jgi:hypothetical protein
MNASHPATTDHFPTHLWAIEITDASGHFAGFYVNAQNTTRTMSAECTYPGAQADRIARALTAAQMSFGPADLTAAPCPTYRAVLVA